MIRSPASPRPKQLACASVKDGKSGWTKGISNSCPDQVQLVAQSVDTTELNGHAVPKWRVRLMEESDVVEVLRIQRLCYDPEYREQPESYYGRIRLYPQGNIVIEVPVLDEENKGGQQRTEAVGGGEEESSEDDDTNDEFCNDSTSSSDDDDSEADDSNDEPGNDSASSSDSEEDLLARFSAAKATPRWRIAGYIQAQPFPRGGINDVNDLTQLERWIKERGSPTDKAGSRADDSDVIYVHEIAMDPAFRGQGLTAPLTSYVEQLTAREGFSLVTLVSLGPALGFWKRNGFILCRELDYGGHECYYMEKPLRGK